MGATGIEWTKGPNGEPGFTFNPWIGCTKILGSDPEKSACLHCYAETASAKFGSPWGPHADRRGVSESTWLAPLAWNRRAARLGQRFRVFSGSMCDIMDNHRSIQPPWRTRLYWTVEETPNLDWLFLTKRPELARRNLPERWLKDWPKNLWFGTTVETQKAAEQRIPYLLNLPAPVLFLSMEPLLERVDLRSIRVQGGLLDALAGFIRKPHQPAIVNGHAFGGVPVRRLGWIITGGESGRLVEIRDTPDEWMIDLGKQCAATRTPFFAKQLSQLRHRKTYKDFDQFPPGLRVRQHPQPRIAA